MGGTVGAHAAHAIKCCAVVTYKNLSQPNFARVLRTLRMRCSVVGAPFATANNSAHTLCISAQKLRCLKSRHSLLLLRLSLNKLSVLRLSLNSCWY